MLSQDKMNVVIYAMRIRYGRGEDVEEKLKSYPNLTDAEKYKVLRAVTEEG